MTKSRIDISNWIIHFVHQRNPQNDPETFLFDPKTEEFGTMPDGFDYEGKPLYKKSDYEENYHYLETDASAFSVVKKILKNGYIQAGWSIRSGKVTVYGPKAAVCFTEMPLYSLIEYAKSRSSINLVQDYGIAFLRDEVFKAGARPVIYGLSSDHEEAKRNDEFYGIGFRTLSSKCGIGLREQYRYVATSIGGSRWIDWTHEREWRWADLDDLHYEPGLSFFCRNDYHRFSKCVVIVRTADEANQIINLLKRLYDSKSDEFGREFDLSLIENTAVLNLDELSKFIDDVKTLRLDDLPFKQLPKLTKVKASADMLNKVRVAWEKANEIAFNKSKELHDNFPCKRGEELLGPCGFSNVITYGSHSEITAALLELGIATAHSDKYVLYGLRTFPSQLLDIEEAGTKAASKFLEEELGQNFFYHSHMD